MKKIIFILFVGLLFISCRKNTEKAYLFEMEYPVDFTINAGIGPFVTHYFDIQALPTFSDSLFAYHHVDPATIESILPRKGRMEAIFDDVEYDFIKSIEVEFFNAENGQIVGTIVPAFYRDPVPNKTGRVVDLVSEEADLKQFLLKDKMNVRIKLKLFGASPKTIESRLILKFAVR